MSERTPKALRSRMASGNDVRWEDRGRADLPTHTVGEEALERDLHELGFSCFIKIG